MSHRRPAALLGLIAAALAFPTAAHARTDAVASFDGAKIKVNFFPAKDLKTGAKAPTVLFGPGWSSPGDTNEDSASDPGTGTIGVGPLRRAGFNVLTWDPRGFGDSEGQVSVDGPDFEGKDVQALISYVAQQPEAQLDDAAAKDPRVGMAGASYGGGIQLVAAGLDRRIDAIVPDIAWHSLQTSLYKDDTFKSGWASLLSALGEARGRLDPRITDAFARGTATGAIGDENRDWFLSRGPGDLVNAIRIPTLLTQGTVDTLFTLQEAATNYAALQRNSQAPLKMLWFCGGHGACLTDAGDTRKKVERRTIEWLRRYLANDTTVDTGPAFEWVDQTGAELEATSYPPAPAAPLTARSSGGTLALTNAGGSGPSSGGNGVTASISGATNGTKAQNAIELQLKPAAATKDDTLVIGAPRVSFTYSGVAAKADGRLFGQVVDDATGKVLGNLVTPIPVTLDGAQHTVSRDLEIVAATVKPGQSLTLQLVAATTAYGLTQPPAGAITLTDLAATLPTADARKMAVKRLAVTTARTTKRKATVTLTSNANLKNAVVVVRTKRGKAVATKRIALLERGTTTVTLRLKRAAGPKARVTASAVGVTKAARTAR